MRQVMTAIRYLLFGVLCVTGYMALMTWWWVEKTGAAPEVVREASVSSDELERERLEMVRWAAKLAAVERRNKTLLAEVARLERMIAALDASQRAAHAEGLLATEARERVARAARTDEGLRREALAVLGPLGITRIAIGGGR